MEEALLAAADGGFAAAILWPYRGFPDREAVAKATRHMPIVALNHRLEEAPCYLATFDHEKAAYAATKQLIRQGSRRIGVRGHARYARHDPRSIPRLLTGDVRYRAATGTERL